jgi:hypothetical protein
MTRDAAERLPSEVAKASKEIPNQERRQICINRAIPADFNRHAVRELEPLAIIYRQWPAAVHCMSLPPREPSCQTEKQETKLNTAKPPDTATTEQRPEGQPMSGPILA